MRKNLFTRSVFLAFSRGMRRDSFTIPHIPPANRGRIINFYRFYFPRDAHLV